MKKTLTKQMLYPANYCQVFCCLLITFFLSTAAAFAQETTLTGKVTEANNAGLPGVNIQVKGTTNGTVTDANGEYSLKVSEPTVTLVFSYVGFLPQEIAVNKQTKIDVILVEDTKNLEEVVVTALGIKKETRTIGYTTQEVKGQDLIKAREPNAVNSLVGKVAGLTVGISSEMLAAPQLVLRGNTDILYVVDGVPINSDTWNISADDIETYTVLKGPNASALYGIRGLNGAILITTKKGSKDKRGFSIEFNSSTMVDKGFLAIPEVQNEYGSGSDYKYRFGDGPYDEGGTDRRPNVWGPRFEGQGVAQYDSPIGADGKRTLTPWTARGPNNFTNFMQTGVLATNNVSIASSAKDSDIRMSISHSYQKGIAPNTSLQTANFNLSAGYNFSPKVRMEGNLNFNRQFTPNIPDVTYGPNSYTYMFNVYGSAHWDVADMEDYYKSPGKPGVQQYFQEYGRNNNPYFMAYEWLRSHHKNDVYGYGKLTYKINDFLSVSARTQITTWSLLRTEKLPYSTIIYGRNLRQGDYREDRRNLFENNTDVLLSFNKNISPVFNVSAVAGGNVRSFQYNSSFESTDYLIVPGVYNLSNSVNPKLSYNFRSDMQVISAYYSADFTYKNFVTLSTTGRVDKLSTLPKGNNAYFYPSASLSTVVSDYVPLPKVISFLKIRGSYANVKGGLTRSTIGAAHTASGQANPYTYGTQLMSSYDGPSYDNQNGYSIKNSYNNTPSADFAGNLANSTLKPFSVSSYEVGMDVKFLENRLSLDVTHFINENGPRITSAGVASSAGYYGQNVNDVVTEKKGWEVALNGSPLKNPDGLNWDIMMNWSTYVERLKEVANNKASNITGTANLDRIYAVGDRVDAAYGYKLVRDPNGQVIHNSGGLPLNTPEGSTYKKLLGYANNDFVWGINNRFSYKNISFSFQFDGRVGGVIFNEIHADGYQAGRGLETATGALGEARRKEWEGVRDKNVLTGAYVGDGVTITSGSPEFDASGNITNFETLGFAPNTKAVRMQAYAQNLYNLQEPFMTSRTYAKLREVVIGYNLPSSLLAKTFIKNASISLIGRNLLYFAQRKDIDLDQYPASNTVFPPLQSPTTRRYGVNINLTF